MNEIRITRIRENSVNIFLNDSTIEEIKNGKELSMYIGATKVVLKYQKNEPKTIFCPGCGTKIGDRFYSSHSFVCPVCGVYIGQDPDGTLQVRGVK